MTSTDDEEKDYSWSVRQLSVLSSNRHMFDRQLACDVQFIVQGYGDAHAVTVGAHRYVLFSRSPVFYRMFCTSTDEPWKDKDDDGEQTLEQDADEEAKAFGQEEIRIDDMPSGAFKELLRQAACGLLCNNNFVAFMNFRCHSYLIITYLVDMTHCLPAGYMLRLFCPSLCHTRDLCKDG